MNKPLKVAIKTFGCQMNVYDSQVAEGFLKKAGYEITREHEGDDEPQATRAQENARKLTTDADIVLMNTCSVREHAEERVYGRLGMLGKIKRTNPNLIIGLMGCMVEEHKEKLFKRFPQLDLMVGTRNIKELPELIDDVRNNRRHVSKIKQDGISIEYTESINRNMPYHAWLPIMTGCNKVCTFCVVPITRGSEVSMPAREVYREASRLAAEGVKWITLLGQNVNSYDGSEIASSPTAPRNDVLEEGAAKDAVIASEAKQSRMSFPQLLEMLCQIEGLECISFTTSHPQDATEELYRVIARNPKISRRFHLPLQSGSDRMLKRMKRLHTYEDYKNKINLMRELIPDVSITTDIICGFSDENEEDHQATLAALKEIRYDSAFIYKYSVRPGTPAAKLPDNVPMDVKERRHQELMAVQNQITRENNEQMLGQISKVFAEQIGDRNPSQIIGRNSMDKKIVFGRTNETMPGQFYAVRLTQLKHETFLGELV